MTQLCYTRHHRSQLSFCVYGPRRSQLSTFALLDGQGPGTDSPPRYKHSNFREKHLSRGTKEAHKAAASCGQLMQKARSPRLSSSGTVRA
ncbi:hypothetical protein VTN02DRAFT_5340 [Thermoascus thermophilus]